VPQLRLIWELCDWDRVVKPADILLIDDIKHFAFNGDAAHPYIEASLRDELRNSMESFLADSVKIARLRALVQKAHLQRRQFRLSVQQLKRETQSEFVVARERERVHSFEEYFEKESRLVAIWLAEHVGLKQVCENRSLEEFLKIRSVRMAVGMTLSYIWASNIESWKVSPSDSGDLQHVIPAAAAADVLVTHDSGLAELARRVPLAGLPVMTVKELLDSLE
jgi:hypothetical protein